MSHVAFKSSKLKGPKLKWLAIVCLAVAGLAAFVVLGPRFYADASQAAQAATGQKNGRPNFIIILADDLGHADVSTYGSKRIETPNIDSIASDGVLFTRGYVAAPICAPSRAALMTGRYPQRFGFEYNNGPPARDEKEHYGIRPSEITLGQALQQAGYHTGLIGKWHLGSNDEFYPTNRGFDEFYGFLPGATAFIDGARPEVIASRIEGMGEARRTQYSQVMEGADRKIVNNMDKYLTDDFADRASDFIKRNGKEPFFLYVAFNAPHTPLQVTKKYYDRFPHISNQTMRVYAAMVSALDDGVGQILKTLKAEGLDENTIVIFLTDNGCASYTGICACEPLRGAKGTEYEAGVRVPFMVRWPGTLPAGKTYDKPVSSLDIFPTFMKAAGAKLNAERVYDGVDLLPYITGKNTAMPHPELYWLRRPHVAVSDGEWKLWKNENGKFNYLFNLKDDPNEKDNLYSKRPDKVAEMSAKFDKWRKDMSSPDWPSQPDAKLDVCGETMEIPL